MEAYLRSDCASRRSSDDAQQPNSCDKLRRPGGRLESLFSNTLFNHLLRTPSTSVTLRTLGCPSLAWKASQGVPPARFGGRSYRGNRAVGPYTNPRAFTFFPPLGYSHRSGLFAISRPRPSNRRHSRGIRR